jgi:hypothetical protein
MKAVPICWQIKGKDFEWRIHLTSDDHYRYRLTRHSIVGFGSDDIGPFNDFSEAEKYALKDQEKTECRDGR